MASDQNVTTLDPSFLASQHRKGVKEPFLPLSAWPFVSSVFSGSLLPFWLCPYHLLTGAAVRNSKFASCVFSWHRLGNPCFSI